MIERFRVYDMTNEPGDCYTVVDTVPVQIQNQDVRFYIGLNAHPFHPQYGIGQHGEFNELNWRTMQSTRFRSLGKRIKLEDLPPEALKAAKQFIRTQEAP